MSLFSLFVCLWAVFSESNAKWYPRGFNATANDLGEYTYCYKNKEAFLTLIINNAEILYDEMAHFKLVLLPYFEIFSEEILSFHPDDYVFHTMEYNFIHEHEKHKKVLERRVPLEL